MSTSGPDLWCQTSSARPGIDRYVRLMLVQRLHAHFGGLRQRMNDHLPGSGTKIFFVFVDNIKRVVEANAVVDVVGCNCLLVSSGHSNFIV
jgi:hypothetical protein